MRFRRIHVCSLVLAALLLTACSHDEQPEAPTPAEAERLNDGEGMLNQLANEDSPSPAQEARRP